MSDWTQDPTEYEEAAVWNAVLAIFPDATFSADGDGELIVYTNCVYTGKNGEFIMGEINLPVDDEAV